MEEKYCQSCGMPMGETDKMYGIETDGTKSKDYCKYCYENGEFTFNGSMEEMIELCAPNMASANPDITEDKAREMMKEWFPTLKRWNK